MRITVTSVATDSVFPLDIPADLEVENLKAFCEAEAGIPVKEMILLFEGKPLREDKKTVEQCGIKVRHPFPGFAKKKNILYLYFIRAEIRYANAFPVSQKNRSFLGLILIL